MSTTKIINLSVTNPKLADGAVTTAKIAPGAVDADAALTDDSVTSAKLNSTGGSEAVTTDVIRNLNVTTAKLAVGSATSEKIDITGATDPSSLSMVKFFTIPARIHSKRIMVLTGKKVGTLVTTSIIRKPQPGTTNLTIVYAGRQTNISYDEYSSPLNTHQFFAPSGLEFNIDSNFGHLVVTVR